MRVDVELEFAERENLLQILAHEFQHVRDWRPLVKLQREITALRSLESPTPETLKLLARKERQAQKLAGRMPRERMEVRAYRAGEYALAVSGYGPGGAHMPGGLPPGDPSYPAATIALAAIDGYLAGASRLIADGRPLTDRARAYLKGYRRAMLEQTAWAFEHPPTDKEFRDGVRASLRTARLGAVTRRLVTKEAKRLADRTRQTFGSVATPDDAFAAGWRDAYQWRPAAGRAANLR
jgi:hypothetical protein